MMEVLYRGFDGLEVSFASQISDDFCRALEDAKQNAQETHQATVLEWNGEKMLVSECGARGGYAYLVSTGQFGATWFFKKPNLRDPWGIRVSCNSFLTAIKGLGGTRAELNRWLELLHVETVDDGVSIGRIDYAIDFLAPQFELDPNHLVMHSNAGRTDHVEHLDKVVHGRSGRVTSVTVGKMPGRQVIIYDKRAEVVAKSKVGWWSIWNAARAEGNLPSLVASDPLQSRIWRVEFRAGKSRLKDGFGIRSWADLDNRFGDMLSSDADAIRHTSPTNDTNRSRWPDSGLWASVRREIETDLFEMRMWAPPDLIKRVQRDAHDALLERQIIGLLVTRAALNGVSARDLSLFTLESAKAIATDFAKSECRFERKLASAAARYSLIFRHNLSD